MSEKIVVPALGESITEATVSKWLKSVGEEVNSDEPLVELETDKVNVEVPSPSSGVLEKISVKAGSVVEVGALLGSVGENNLNKNKEIQEKKYTPPKSDEKEISLNEEIKKPKKIKEEKKKVTNGVKPMILNEEKSEPALILEDEHIPEKFKLN